jgi:hypothetical protein
VAGDDRPSSAGTATSQRAFSGAALDDLRDAVEVCARIVEAAE